MGLDIHAISCNSMQRRWNWIRRRWKKSPRAGTCQGSPVGVRVRMTANILPTCKTPVANEHKIKKLGRIDLARKSTCPEGTLAYR